MFKRGIDGSLETLRPKADFGAGDNLMATRPIFLSRPSTLPGAFSKEAAKFERYLNGHGFRPVRLGGDSYSTKAPLLAVIDLMKACDGAILLGFPKQTFSIDGFGCDASVVLATPWNQIEGALSYALGKPTLVVAHPGIAGGVFDHGITGEFVCKADLSGSSGKSVPVRVPLARRRLRPRARAERGGWRTGL